MTALDDRHIPDQPSSLPRPSAGIRRGSLPAALSGRDRPHPHDRDPDAGSIESGESLEKRSGAD